MPPPRNPSHPAGAEPRRAGLRRAPPLRDSLGRGLLGETWTSPDQDGRLQAVKRIRVPQLRDRSAIQLASIQRLPRLRHAALLPILDVVFGDDALWIVSELDRGITLRRLLTMTILTPTEAAMIVQRMLEGLDALREWDLEHGDLHANNVHVSPEGEVRLGDWGLRSLASPTRGEGQNVAVGSDLGGAAILSRRILGNSRRWLGRRSPEAAALDEAVTAIPLDGGDDRLRVAVSAVRGRVAAMLDREAGYRAQFDIASRVRAVATRPGTQPAGSAGAAAPDAHRAGRAGGRPPAPSPATIVRPTPDSGAGWSRPDTDLAGPADETEQAPPAASQPPAAAPPAAASPPSPPAAPTSRPPPGARTGPGDAPEPDKEPAPPLGSEEPEAVEAVRDDAPEEEGRDDEPDSWGSTTPPEPAAETASLDADSTPWGMGTAPWEIRERPAAAAGPSPESEDEAEGDAWEAVAEPAEREEPTPTLAARPSRHEARAATAPVDVEGNEEDESLAPGYVGPTEGPEPPAGSGGGVLLVLLVALVVLIGAVAVIVHLRGAGQPAGPGHGAAPITQTAPPPPARATRHAPSPVPQTLPTSAGTIRGIQVRPVTGSCSAGSTCTVRVDLQLVPTVAPQRLAWSFKVIDRCTGAVTQVAGLDFQSGPGWASAYGTTDVSVPPGQALAIVAVTSSPGQTASAPLLIPAQASSCS